LCGGDYGRELGYAARQLREGVGSWYELEHLLRPAGAVGVRVAAAQGAAAERAVAESGHEAGVQQGGLSRS
jgi:hypothetical protein